MEHTYPTFRVTAALDQYIRVKLSSGKLVAAGAADTNSLGTTNRETFKADELVSITPAKVPGVKKMVSSAAIAEQAEFEYAADGKIATLSGGTARGIVLDAAGGADEVIRVLEY